MQASLKNGSKKTKEPPWVQAILKTNIMSTHDHTDVPTVLDLTALRGGQVTEEYLRLNTNTARYVSWIADALGIEQL